MNTVYEIGRELPVKGEYDVLVAGGGIAGVSAALAASRGGARVLLIERMYMVGGLATAGLVAFYLPICDGRGRQVCYGITDELLKLSIQYCHKEGWYPEAWLKGGSLDERLKKRYEAEFNQQLFALDMERVLRESGVCILYGTSVCGVSRDGARIAAVIVENKSGRAAYRVKSVVDATGDADICHYAGAPTVRYAEQNKLAAWSYGYTRGSVRISMTGASDLLYSEDEDETNKLSALRFSGLDGEENSDMVQLAHSVIHNNFIRRHCEDASYEPVTLATIPQLRMTRRLSGDYTLDEPEFHKRFRDSIGLIPNWKKAGPVYEIPFRSLYHSSVPNLLCAGRCISVTDAMWDVTRVIPPCAVTGQAAGCAAALGDDFTALSMERLQTALRAAGVSLHEEELQDRI